MSTRHSAVNGTASSTEGVRTDAADTEAVASEGTIQATVDAAPETLVVAAAAALRRSSPTVSAWSQAALARLASVLARASDSFDQANAEAGTRPSN